MRTLEELVDRRNGRRAVADRKSHALRTAATAVAGGEHAGQAGLHRAWRPGFFPDGENCNLLTGQHEALIISHDGRGEKVGSRLCSDENEQTRSKFFFYFPVWFAHTYALNMFDAFDSNDFRVVANSDFLVRQDSIRQVGRHLSQIRATHQQRDFVGGLGQKHCGLASRITAANYMGYGTSTESSLNIGRAVIHASALQGIEAFDVQESVGHTRSDDHRFPQHVIAFDGSHSVEPITASLQVGHRARDVEVCSELQSLKIDQMSEIAASDAVRKTGIILNPGCRTGLASWPEAVQNETGQTFRGCVNCSSQTRRARAQNQNVTN